MSDNEPRERGEGFGAGRRMAKRRGRASEAVHKASVPAGATVLAVGAVLVAGWPGRPRWTAPGRRWPLWRAAQGLRILCRQDRGGRLQGHPRLRRYISERGKIEPRRKLGTCARHQRSLTIAIKRARHVALLPFTTATGSDQDPGTHDSSAPGMTEIRHTRRAPSSGRWTGQPGAMPDREYGRHAATR